MRSFLLLLGLLFLLAACQESKKKLTKADVIDMAVEDKVQVLLTNKRERCRTEALEQAAAIVDSILIARAKASKDTITKPPRPVKPERPEILAPADSTPIRPFLSKDTSATKSN